MSYLKTGLISLMFAGLVGCATSKPTMTNEGYSRFAGASAALSHCIQQGWVDAPTAALGKRYLESNVRAFSVDYARLNREEADIVRNHAKPVQSDCNKLAVTIHSRYQTIQANNQAVEYNDRQTQDIINSTKIRNTNCNRIGTSTLCSTY